MMITKWLSKRIKNLLRNNPKMKIRDIKEKSQRKWNIGVNKTKTIRSRFVARDMMDGSFLGDYIRTYDYGHEILRKSLGSTVKLNDTSMEESVDDTSPYFKRLYVCYANYKESFKV